MGSKEQELDMILSEELGLKDPTFSQLPERKKGMIMTPQEMNVTESSFKELMGDIGGFSRYHVRTAIIETLKNITQQSFGGINIFESPLVDKNVRTKYKHEFIKNNLSQEEYSNKIKHKVRYHSFLSGLVIPLRTPKWSVGSKSRLVISCDNYLVNIQISVQFYVDNVDKWVSVPCRTNTVKETIMNLFPQE